MPPMKKESSFFKLRSDRTNYWIMQRDDKNLIKYTTVDGYRMCFMFSVWYPSSFKTSELIDKLIIISYKYVMNAAFYAAFAIKSRF